MKPKSISRDAKRRRLGHEVEGGATGALAGAIVGAAAGPPGVVAGAVLGGLAGTLTGAVLDTESSRKAEHERELDAEVGVIEGDIGAPGLKHPPERSGAYSRASSGAESTQAGEEPAEGPMQVPE